MGLTGWVFNNNGYGKLAAVIKDRLGIELNHDYKPILLMNETGSNSTLDGIKVERWSPLYFLLLLVGSLVGSLLAEAHRQRQLEAERLLKSYPCATERLADQSFAPI